VTVLIGDPQGVLADHEIPRLATIVFGVIATFLAIGSKSIIELFATAHTILGGIVIPVLVAGLSWKIRSKKFQTGGKNSRLTPWGVSAQGSLSPPCPYQQAYCGE
jgi:hypothetical protein